MAQSWPSGIETTVVVNDDKVPRFELLPEGQITEARRRLAKANE